MRVQSQSFLIEEIFLAGEVSGEASGTFTYSDDGHSIYIEKVVVESTAFVANHSGDIVSLAPSDEKAVHEICEELITKAVEAEGEVYGKLVLSADSATAKNIGAKLSDETESELKSE